MGGLFKSPKTVTPPPVPEPEAIPTVTSEVSPEAKPAAKKKRRRGRAETILTGELEPITTKKTLLGGQ